LGGGPIPTRGIHCGTLYMYVLCVLDTTQMSYLYTTSSDKIFYIVLPTTIQYNN
jgi:hypothetical protein